MDFNGWEVDVMVLEPCLGYFLTQQDTYLLLESNLLKQPICGVWPWITLMQPIESWWAKS
jgi:hypothetical protein